MLALQKFFEERKVRTPYGAVKANSLPPQGEDKWNREKVQSGDPKLEREFRGVDGVKAAKLYGEQDQIGKRLSATSTKLSGRSLKDLSNGVLRGMSIEKERYRDLFWTESGL